LSKKGLLVIISCGEAKIWKNNPVAGPTPASEAYISPVFKVSKQYAVKFGEKWLVISAKYGFIEPDFLIPEYYDVKIGDKGSISVDRLRRQIKEKRLNRFQQIEVIGSKDYYDTIRQAFEGENIPVRHVNEGRGFAPVLIKFLKSLMKEGDA
jgi:hypothetical protein